MAETGKKILMLETKSEKLKYDIQAEEVSNCYFQ